VRLPSTFTSPITVIGPVMVVSFVIFKPKTIQIPFIQVGKGLTIGGGPLNQ
jgi:hypothetical protein